MSDDRIDLEQLRASAFKSEEPKARTVVSLAWLRQVHGELTAGRVAQAQLSRARTVDDVIQDLRTGPIERTSTL
ncbi:hypothetical protein IP68_02265 [Blastomonas sp. AAP25]|uniref:hypothetical protein n=1 Tax=Blastomonas sp. AAP25 TaxID=1523416 RepID=UPI0006B9BD7F|nr:hypothetical protein [Blastomonas sp. AAP25]KPF76740.1 hypothetical protein IP68_02265 [Blastomonas sp. AAP25]